MKIVTLLFMGLVTGAIGYIYLLPNVKSFPLNAENDVAPVLNLGEKCIGTSCVPNAEIKNQLEISRTTQTETIKVVDKGEPKSTQSYPQYTEFVNPSGYVNSGPFMLSDVVGKKIIVIEFITYSCINCQRTFPYMQSWHTKYEKDGVLVVGIHTPEFAYERNRDNVALAMAKEGITFPIVLDNDYQTWAAYANRFWPHRYVIDYEGNVVFDHIGEGEYAKTEAVIQELLKTKPADTKLN